MNYEKAEIQMSSMYWNHFLYTFLKIIGAQIIIYQIWGNSVLQQIEYKNII